MWKKELLALVIKYKFEIIEFIKDILFKKEDEKVEITETEHFKKKEIAVSSSYPKLAVLPTEKEIVENINYTLKQMEKIRAIAGNIPLKINSFYRSEELNKAVKGATNSYHKKGFAVDFTANTDIKKLYDKLLEMELENVVELIYYQKQNFIHIAFKVM